MKNTRNITKDLVWIGVNDRRLALFENIFPIPKGISYNSYLLKDEKTVLFDTVDKDSSFEFLENLEAELGGKALDYLIINHMEPDHCATISEVLFRYPTVKIVCNNLAQTMIKQFFDVNIDEKTIIIKENDTLNTGKHTLTFLMAPMVHWPETMVTYDTTDKILFSGDAFGTFGAMSGNIFADELNFEKDWLEDARRYYSNIVGKYGIQVQNLLKKTENLEIKMICSLHGPIWRENIEWIIEKYQKWSKYESEESAVTIFCGSIYGHTENAAEILAVKLADKGVKNITLYDVSKFDSSYLVSEAFRCSHIVIASASYNAGIFANMENVLHHLKAHNLQNRKVAIIENGSWAPCACSAIEKFVSEMKNIEIIPPKITIKSSLKSNQEEVLDELAENIFKSL